ncbi:DNA damage-regulated autophagy modulator protein 2-like [Hyla sarda]|uniref:DNA damage-regulated autophagy modulator protein 2-like n=1 Tax=Hyla sarda TaxID=327740 RepID=UPI0024C424E5|nr:DNA damage-regulated autophagy modulator protein 2-like [Hyla sarda]
MTSPTLAILPLFWAIWTFVGVLTTFTMTIVQGHYQTGIISISDTGAQYPESIVLTVVSTVSSLLEAGILFIIYKSMEIQALKKILCGVTCQTWMLAFGWMTCVGNIITPLIQDSAMLNDSCLAVLSSMVIYGGISLASQLYPGSRDRRCRRLTTTVLSVTILLANIIRLSCKMAAMYTCTSEYCTQSSRITLTILEWVVLVCSFISQIMLYWDFKLLTMTTSKSDMIEAESVLAVDPLKVPLLDRALEDQLDDMTPEETSSCDHVILDLFSAEDTPTSD